MKRIILPLIAGILVAFAVAGPLLVPVDPLAQNILARFAPVGTPGHLLGTDNFGRDILARIATGAQVELLTALASTMIALSLGVSIGVTAAYSRGLTEDFLMRGIDVMLSIPPLILALLVVAVLGPSVPTLIGVLALLFTPGFARVAYGQTLSVRSRPFIQAAIIFGAPRRSIILGQILPNIVAPLLAQASLTIASAILVGSGLGYLGLGIRPPMPSWGGMVADGQRYLATHPMLMLIPGLFVVSAILTFSALGDTLRTLWDPREQGGR
ncbi:peptide/nickel transport system permease protein [Pseudochelatococcus lubricantis]|uniref:Peptide/nickel transport system permease protein n=1 Tax=Pseudochelatococcus lubricantis TaxID=1538102 RepID=A0ABX0V0W7_9HYPH|nr:ABC transporter permease [Pseudochelatococcus lubricantis]NIJ58816.1 peptide/nickel transport system permease protein [Pseudochelatococcus lubricantis]